MILKGIIYKAINKINNKIYIGQTWQKLNDRIYAHVTRKNCNYFHNAIKKYGIDTFDWEMIFESNIQLELDNKEKYFINLYKSNIHEFGYNLQEGGRGGKPNDATKNKMSESAKKYFKSNIAKIKHGKIQKERFNNFNERVKHSRSHGGKPFYVRKENQMYTFETQSDAAKKLNIGQSSISSALRGKSKNAHGWMFSYNPISKYTINQSRINVPFYAIKNNKKIEFNCQTYAEKILKVANIGLVLQGKRKTAGGWYFIYKYNNDGNLNIV